MKFIEKRSNKYMNKDIIRFGIIVKIEKYDTTNNETIVWSHEFEKNEIIQLDIKNELYWDIRSSSTDNASLIMNNTNNEFFDKLWIATKDLSKLIGAQVTILGDYIKEDGEFAYGWSDLMFKWYVLFWWSIVTVNIDDSTSRVQLDIWDNSSELRKVPVYHQYDNTIPYTTGNSWLIKELYFIGWVIRYALKFWTKAFWYNWIKRFRCSRVTAINNWAKKITVNDWADFQVWELVKLWYHTKLDNYEENYIKAVNLSTYEVELEFPLKNAHLSWEWCSLEHHTMWQDSWTYFTTGIKLNANASVWAKKIKVSNLNQALFLYNMIWSSVKFKIWTYEEHFKIENIVWNDIYVYQDIVHTHNVWEWLDDSKMYIDAGHYLSNDPDLPAYVWFEKEEMLWDVIVWMANANGWKISCKGDNNNIFLLWNGLTNTFITTESSNYCIKFDSMKSLYGWNSNVITFSDEYYSDKEYNVGEWTIGYNRYNSIIEDGIKASTNFDECINYCKINPQIRRIDDTDRSIWNLYESIAIPAGWSTQFTIECNDPIDKYIWPMLWNPAYTAWADYAANSLPNGTGTDMTASLSNIEVIKPTSAKQFDIRVTNSAGSKIYLTKFELKGRLYTIFKDDRHIAVYKDETAIKDNWFYPIEMNNKYINNLFYSKDLAKNIVNLYKGNYEKRNIDITLNIAVEVGDIVRVYSTIFENDFVGRVLRVEHSFWDWWYFTKLELWLLVSWTFVESWLVPLVLPPPITTSTITDTFDNNNNIDPVTIPYHMNYSNYFTWDRYVNNNFKNWISKWGKLTLTIN